MTTKFNEKLKIWTGPQPHPLYNPNSSLGQIILHCLNRNPTKIGQISHNGPQLTNNEIRLRSIRVAQNLRKNDYRQGMVCGFYTKNTPNLAPTVFGCFTIGIAVNPINPNYKRDEIVHMFRLTKPSLVFCDSDNAATLVDALIEMQLNIPIYCFGESAVGIKSADDLLVETGTENLFEAPDIGDASKEIAAIVCSSGTSGLSKGVCLSHAALLHHFYLVDLNEDDVVFTFSQMYWITGIGIMIMGTVSGSTRIISAEGFTPDSLLDILEQHKVTFHQSSQFQLMGMLNSKRFTKTNLSHLKYLIAGGSLISEHLIDKVNPYLPNSFVATVYGISEAAGAVAYNYPVAKSGSVGALCRGVVIKIVNEDGHNCGIAESGEICVKQTFRFLGYSNSEVETNEAMDAEEYFHTGDIGYIDTDGYVFLIDRKKDMFKYVNYQIAPSEIENIIMAHPGVKDVCVVGIPDLVYTNLPAALIIKRDYANLQEEDVMNMVKDKLSDAKQLRGGVYFVDEFPMTQTGKILRRDLRDIAAELFKQTPI